MGMFQMSCPFCCIIFAVLPRANDCILRAINSETLHGLPFLSSAGNEASFITFDTVVGSLKLPVFSAKAAICYHKILLYIPVTSLPRNFQFFKASSSGYIISYDTKIACNILYIALVQKTIFANPRALARGCKYCRYPRAI